MASYEMPTYTEKIEYDLVESTCRKKGLSEVETSAFLYIYTTTKNGKLGHEAFDGAAGLTLEEQLQHIEAYSFLYSRAEVDMFKRLHSDREFREQMVKRYMSDIKSQVDYILDLEFFNEQQSNKDLRTLLAISKSPFHHNLF